MSRSPLVTAFVVMLLVPSGAVAQSAKPPDGTVVDQTPCPPYEAPTYEDYVAGAEKAHAGEVEAARREGHTMRTPVGVASREEHARAVAVSRNTACRRIMYMSDGLKVAGMMWRPADQGEKRLPLLIFLRGGNRDFSRVMPWHRFHRLSAAGFVVLATQYRGVDDGEGVEEYGGADVHDVMNLVPVAASLGFVDTSNVFLFGWSRGGMETLIALKQGMKVNAAAVGGPLLDLLAEARRRPELPKNVWSQLIPGFAARPDEVMRDRSPMYWPERIDAPLLLMHGGGDWRASPAETLNFAQKLQSLGKTYELVIYADDDHGITGHAVDRDRRVVEWFRRYMR